MVIPSSDGPSDRDHSKRPFRFQQGPSRRAHLHPAMPQKRCLTSPGRPGKLNRVRGVTIRRESPCAIVAAAARRRRAARSNWTFKAEAAATDPIRPAKVHDAGRGVERSMHARGFGVARGLLPTGSGSSRRNPSVLSQEKRRPGPGFLVLHLPRRGSQAAVQVATTRGI